MSIILYPREIKATPASVRAWEVSKRVEPLARGLYEARMAHLGQGGLGWEHLTPKQRSQFRDEIEALIKGEK